MTDNTKMVDLPWHDGTIRTVPEGTPYQSLDRRALYAHKDGYNLRHGGFYSYHDETSAAVRIFTEAPEPPVKVTVPTGIGAIVSASMYPNEPCYVLGPDGWRSLRTYIKFDPSEIAEELRDGARVLYEGVDE